MDLSLILKDKLPIVDNIMNVDFNKTQLPCMNQPSKDVQEPSVQQVYSLDRRLLYSLSGCQIAFIT